MEKGRIGLWIIAKERKAHAVMLLGIGQCVRHGKIQGSPVLRFIVIPFATTSSSVVRIYVLHSTECSIIATMGTLVNEQKSSVEVAEEKRSRLRQLPIVT